MKMEFRSILSKKVVLQQFNYNTILQIFRKTCHLIEIEKEKCLLQPVEIVEMNAKYHLNQKKTDQFTVENVFKIINLRNVVTLDMEEDPIMAGMIEVQDSVEAQETVDREKCLLQPVEIVEMNAKYHLNQKKTDQFTVENVFKIIDKIKKSF